MAEDATNGNGDAQKEPTPYEKMPVPLQKLWEERLFNTVKQRHSLLIGDAWLTWAFLWWMLLASFFLLSFVDSTRFPVHKETCYSLAVFFLYYFIIGFVRRQTERNLVLLSAQHSDPAYHRSDAFKEKKPYRKEDDPPLARFAFRMRTAIGLPRRGLSQGSVVVFQFLAGFAYVGNYAYYVFWKGATGPENFSPLFWLVHATVTGGGILILFKNYGFLVDTNRLLKLIEGLAGTILGHGHTSVSVEPREKTPCPEETKKKKKK